jgi:hypothetical protein
MTKMPWEQELPCGCIPGYRRCHGHEYWREKMIDAIPRYNSGKITYPQFRKKQRRVIEHHRRETNGQHKTD